MPSMRITPDSRFLVTLLDEHGQRVRVPLVAPPGPFDFDHSENRIDVDNVSLSVAEFVATSPDGSEEQVFAFERGVLAGSLAEARTPSLLDRARDAARSADRD